MVKSVLLSIPREHDFGCLSEQKQCRSAELAFADLGQLEHKYPNRLRKWLGFDLWGSGAHYR